MPKSYIDSKTNDFLVDEKLGKILREFFQEKLNLSDQQVKSLIEERKELFLPISVFKNKLSTLEIVVKYLHETEKLSFSEISRLISRDERTIWHAYRRSTRKGISLVIYESKLKIPVSIFSSRKYAPLEALVAYLKDSHSLKNKEIADLLNLSSKTVWTVYQRKKRKDGSK